MEASALTQAGANGLLARRSPLLRLQGDERLVALIRGGHDRAFEVLFVRYQPRLLAFCRHLLGSPQDAEDVLQEVFAAAHSAILADQRAINVRPWLYRIARNRCLNHLRRPVADGQDSMDVHPHENGTTTLERVQSREQLREIFSDVRELPETQRAALVLREIDDLSYTEIAEAMGTTLPAVKSLLVRARMSLAEAGEARILTCDEVRLELAEAAEGLSKLSGPGRRHVRDCASCRRYRRQLRSSTRALAGLAPFGLLALLQKLFGAKLGGGSAAGELGGGSAAGGAAGTAGSAGGAAGTAGGVAAAAGGSGATLGGAVAAAGGAAGGIGGALGAKAAVGMATAALITAGAVGVKGVHDPGKPASLSPTSAAVYDEDGGVNARASAAHHRASLADQPPAQPAPAAEPAAPTAPVAAPTEAPAPAPAPADTAPADDTSADGAAAADTSTSDGTSTDDTTVGGSSTDDSSTGDIVVSDPAPVDPAPTTNPPTIDPAPAP